MKTKILVLTVIFAVLRIETAWALNSCAWNYVPKPATTFRTWDVIAPGAMDLKQAPIGSAMASSPPITIHNEMWQIICPFPSEPMYRLSATIKQGELVDGFSDVYKIGLSGIGVRFVVLAYTNGSIPLLYESPNGDSKFGNAIQKMRIDFIRTSRDVVPGEANINFTIHQSMNGWDAAAIKVSGTTKLTTHSYFSGCTGIETLNIPMGRVGSGNLGASQNPFNLDVLCSGMAAGTKVPVKVYFEGSSDGPGRLNLEPGGAQGVEIALLNDRGVKLPFSLGSALNLTWIRSEPKGEIYRLPVVAEYVKKASQKIEPGKANAVLNYILEYN